MTPKSTALEISAICGLFILLALWGMVWDFTSGLLTSGIDGIMLLFVCAMMAGIFFLIMLMQLNHSGILPTPAFLRPAPKLATATKAAIAAAPAAKAPGATAAAPAAKAPAPNPAAAAPKPGVPPTTPKPASPAAATTPAAPPTAQRPAAPAPAVAPEPAKPAATAPAEPSAVPPAVTEK